MSDCGRQLAAASYTCDAAIEKEIVRNLIAPSGAAIPT
jgi:hypothetical protein